MGVTVNDPICIKIDNLQAKSCTRGTWMETKLREASARLARGTFDMRSDWVAELRSALEAQVDYVGTTGNYDDLNLFCPSRIQVAHFCAI